MIITVTRTMSKKKNIKIVFKICYRLAYLIGRWAEESVMAKEPNHEILWNRNTLSRSFSLQELFALLFSIFCICNADFSNHIFVSHMV